MGHSKPTSSLPPRKKQKRDTDTNGISKSTIEALEFSLTSSPTASLNPLADLISISKSSSDPKIVSAALYAAYRALVRLSKQEGRLHSTTGVENEVEEVKIVRKWLNERVSDFGDVLCGLMKDEEKSLRISAMEIHLSLLTHLSTALSNATSQPQIRLPHFRKLVKGLIICPPSPRPTSDPDAGEGRGKVEMDVRDKFLENHLSVHDDLRWFFFREVALILNSERLREQSPHVADNVLYYLEKLTTMPTDPKEINEFWIKELSKAPPKPKAKGKQGKSSNSSTATGDSNGGEPMDVEEDSGEAAEDWTKFFDEEETKPSDERQAQVQVANLSIHQSLHSLLSHRQQFTACWLSLLPHIASSSTLSSRALGVLHRGVLPHLINPVRLMDWIGGCVDFGGSIGLLALNALFTLIRDHNLDYPDFYTRLYAFLDRNVLHLKHRARFFRLTELFLSSTHLPSTLLASFVKRLSRLSLSAPPAAIVMIIPFVYNILKRHPSLMVMIHQPRIDQYTDPFDPKEPSPLLTNAIASSLWELQAQTEHYLASVSTLAKIFSEAFTKPSYSMEDFLDHTYSTLFETEVKRKIRNDPAMAIEFKKETLFPPRSEGEDEENEAQLTGDVVAQLWCF